MAEHPNAALARRALDGVDRGDSSAMVALLADDIVWREMGRDEPIRGKDAVLARLAELGGVADVRTKLHDVVANDEHGVALVTARATRGGRTLTYRVAEIVHFRDGKVTERWAFSDDTERIVRFFADSPD
jgi:hypothetical protein